MSALRIAIALVLAVVFLAADASAQERERKNPSHRQILTGEWTMPDWVADPEMRAVLEAWMKNAKGTGQGGQLTPKDRERLLEQVRRMLEQMPPGGGFPSPEELQRLKGYSELLESYRTMFEDLQRREREPTLEDALHDWMSDLAHDLQEQGGGEQWFDPMAGDNPPILSPEGAKLMRDLLQDIKVDPKLREELNRSLAGVKDALKGVRDWWRSRPQPERADGSKADPAKTDPAPTPTDPGGGPTGGPAGPRALPSLPGVPDLPVRELLIVVIWAGGIALTLFGLWLLWDLLSVRVRATLAKWRVRRPPLPAAFDGPDAYFRYFRELMEYLNRRPVAGRTHRELGEGASDQHPAAAGASREAAEVYETLYYDRRVRSRWNELCARAHAVCRAALDAVRD